VPLRLFTAETLFMYEPDTSSQGSRWVAENYSTSKSSSEDFFFGGGAGFESGTEKFMIGYWYL
jgi:hypothetical protein